MNPADYPVNPAEPVSLARPPALKEGDRVAVLCVSSPVEPEALNAGLDALRFAGLDPVTYPSAHDPGTMRPYLAGDDAMRAGDLRAAAAARTLDDFGVVLADHADYPHSICAHPDPAAHPCEQGATIASVLMDLTARRIWLAAGNPCQTPYEQLDIAL